MMVITMPISSDSYRNLAYKVLKKHGSPMNYQDLMEEVLKIRNKKAGKTPSQTLRVEISKDPRFIRVNRGTYGLSEWSKKK